MAGRKPAAVVAAAKAAEQQAREDTQRKAYVGGGDAAAIAGVSPWRTRLQVYLAKRGETPVNDMTIAPAKQKLFKRGKRAEVVAIDMLIEDYDFKVTVRSTEDKPNRYTHPDFDFLRAEIDFEWEVTEEIAALYDLDKDLIGTIQNGEVKSVHPRAFYQHYGEEGSDEIPIEYGAQAMHGLLVTGKKVTLFAVLAGWDDLTFFIVKRDEDTIDGLLAMELEFWFTNVQGGIPPAPVNLPDVQKLFKPDLETKIEATAEILQVVAEYKRRKAQANLLTKEGGILDDLQYQLGVFLLGAQQLEKPTKKGRHAITHDSKAILQVVYQSQERLDGQMLKEDFPEADAKCRKPVSFFKFEIPRGSA